MKTDLHLVTWNRPKMSELVIETIARNTKQGSYNLIVYDNGSEDVTWISRLSAQGLINEFNLQLENGGLEHARQMLLNYYTNSEYFVCIDNDCLPPPILNGKDWLERMIELMEKYPEFAAISMRTPVMIGTGNIFEEADKVGDDILEFGHPGGSFRIMRVGAVKAVGGWDRSAPGRGSEETYICGKLRDAGYRTAFAVQIKCLHLFGTRGKNPTDSWGYDKNLKPEDTGHRSIDHPALTNGDNKEELLMYAAENDVENYFSSKVKI